MSLDRLRKYDAQRSKKLAENAEKVEAPKDVESIQDGAGQEANEPVDEESQTEITEGKGTPIDDELEEYTPPKAKKKKAKKKVNTST